MLTKDDFTVKKVPNDVDEECQVVMEEYIHTKTGKKLAYMIFDTYTKQYSCRFEILTDVELQVVGQGSSGEVDLVDSLYIYSLPYKEPEKAFAEALFSYNRFCEGLVGTER